MAAMNMSTATIQVSVRIQRACGHTNAEMKSQTAMAAFKGILTSDEVHHIYDYLTSIKTQ